MRLLYINDALAIYGGLERILVDKMNMLADEGYEVYLITVNQGQHPIPYSLNSNVQHIDLNICSHQEYQFSGFMKLYKKFQFQRQFQHSLSEKVREISPNIIICMRIEMMKIVAKVKGAIPLVFESHSSCLGSHYIPHKKLKLLYIDYINRFANKAQLVVALTEGDAKEWRKINPSVSVIPNIVKSNKTGVYSDGSSKSVVFVGRFSEQKGFDSLLRIWKTVSSRHKDWYLHIYGGYGNKQECLHSEIEKLNYNIIIHDTTPNLINEYAYYSMLLLTSRYEPFGLVLPEAMNCGLPVVAFDCPYGPADIITDGKDGFLIQGRDEELFIEKVCWLIEHPVERIKMGKLGVISSQRYSASKILPLWKHLFDNLSC